MKLIKELKWQGENMEKRGIGMMISIVNLIILFTIFTLYQNALGCDTDNPINKGGPDDHPYIVFDGGQGPGFCLRKGQGMPIYWVNTSTRTLVVQDTDFAYAGLGPKIAMTRTYNYPRSTDPPNLSSTFGKSWSFAYESTVDHSGQSSSPKKVTLHGGSGQSADWTINLSSPTPVEASPPVGIHDKPLFHHRLTWYGSYWLFEEKKTRLTYRYDKVAGSNISRLVSIADSDGNAVTINYNQDGTIHGITDAAGRLTTFAYDANKRCTSLTTPDGRQATYEYDSNGNLIKTFDFLGSMVTYTYDTYHYMTSMTAAGKTTQFNREGYSQIQSITDARGNVTHYEGDFYGSTLITDPEGGVRTYSNTGDYGSTSGIRDALGNGYSLSYWVDSNPTDLYDPNDHHTSFEYDSRGNLTKITDPLGNVTTYVYDVNDNLISKTDPLGNAWTYTYDDYNHLTKIKSPMGNETTMDYDDMGLLIRITDANMNITTFTYDDFGNLETITDSLANKTQFTYDPEGLRQTAITDARGNKTQFDYDANDRLTKVTKPDSTVKTYTYDCCANASMTDENGNTTTLTRDPLLLVTQITDPLGKTVQQSYDKNGNLISVVDPRGQTLTRAYDASNRLVSRTNPKGHTAQMGYDSNGNLISFTDQRGKQTAFTYGYDNLLLSATDGLGKTVTYARDVGGRLSTITNVRGSTINFTYDQDNRMTQKKHNGAVAATFGYDAMGNIATLADTTGTTAYTYNGRGQVTKIEYPDGKILSAIYDSVGNVSSLNYPGGLVVNYTYDSRNRVSSVAWDGNSISYTYDPVGNVTQEVRSNGTESLYTYDVNHRVTQIQHKKGANPFVQISFTRDAAGNTVQETRSLPLSPIITTKTVSASYNDANQMTTRGSNSYVYDTDGNLLSITGSESFSVIYDPENRPTSITRNGVTTTYVYNGFGNRVRTDAGGEVRNNYYDPLGNLLFQTNGTGQIVASYIYRERRLVAMKNSSGLYFYHFDKAGNTIALTDQGGNISAAYAYDPFGKVSNSTVSTPNPFTYVGQFGVMDEGGGFFFMKNRYYDSTAGRFLQKDPIGLYGGTNLYRYAGNNPIERIDPEGLSAIIIIGAAIVAVEQLGYIIGENIYDPSIKVSKDPKGASATELWTFTETGPSFEEMPEVIKEATMVHEAQHKYNQCRLIKPWTWGNPFNTYGREIDAHQAEHTWLLGRLAEHRTGEKGDIVKRIRSINRSLADGAKVLKRDYGKPMSWWQKSLQW